MSVCRRQSILVLGTALLLPIVARAADVAPVSPSKAVTTSAMTPEGVVAQASSEKRDPPKSVCHEIISPENFEAVVPDKLDLALHKDESLSIVVKNLGRRKAMAHFEIRAFSSAQDTSVRISSMEVAPGSSTTFKLSPASMKLFETPLDWSGELTIIAAVASKAGSRESERPIRLWFHPEKKVWHIYDAQVRAARYDGGAVSPRAIEMLRANPGDKGAEQFGPVRVVKISDSTKVNPLPEEGPSEQGPK